MADAYWEVTDLEDVQRPANGLSELFATLAGPTGQVPIAIPPEALLNCADFQRCALCLAGVVYCKRSCAGRLALAAGEAWRTFTSDIRAKRTAQEQNPN